MIEMMQDNDTNENGPMGKGEAGCAAKATESMQRPSNLARVSSGTLSAPKSQLTIGQLERALLQRFPAADAEEWDRTGLLIGDPARTVTGVACALDPTVAAIEAAAAAGANVLLTHHPAFLTPPTSFKPGASVAENPGAGVYRAIELGVALMNFHTALDVSHEAQAMLPGMLGLTCHGVVEPIAGDETKGYGQLCSLKGETLTLSQLAARCTSVFGRAPRVWGNLSRDMKRIVTCTGAAGPTVRKSYEAHADCLIAGEVKYHDALDFSTAGLCIIELGHDTSELPFAGVLAGAARDAGVPADGVIIVGQNDNWTHPETMRL